MRTSYNSFTSEAFIFIGDVYLALFAMKPLKTLLEENKIVFSLNIFYFFIYLSSNKLYWIEDQLTDVSTQFYASASWRWWAGVGELNRQWLDCNSWEISIWKVY